MAGSLPSSQFGKTGREGGEAAEADRLHLGIIAAAITLSLLLVWLVTSDLMLLAVTAAGLIGLGGFILVAARIQRPIGRLLILPSNWIVPLWPLATGQGACYVPMADSICGSKGYRRRRTLA